MVKTSTHITQGHGFESCHVMTGGAAGSTRAFLRAARASPKTCTHESYGAREKNRERSVRIRSDSTSSPLRARDLFLLVSLLLQPKKGVVPALTSYLPYLTTSDLPMYLIRFYIQHRTCAREEPVPTFRCTDCACGRFSSRQRVTGLKEGASLNEDAQTLGKMLGYTEALPITKSWRVGRDTT